PRGKARQKGWGPVRRWTPPAVRRGARRACGPPRAEPAVRALQRRSAQRGGAVAAAGGADGDLHQAMRAGLLAHLAGLLLRAAECLEEAIVGTDEEEDRGRNDQEAQHVVDEEAVVEGDGAGCTRLGETGVLSPGQVHVEVGEIHAA